MRTSTAWGQRSCMPEIGRTTSDWSKCWPAWPYCGERVETGNSETLASPNDSMKAQRGLSNTQNQLADALDLGLDASWGPRLAQPFLPLPCGGASLVSVTQSKQGEYASGSSQEENAAVSYHPSRTCAYRYASLEQCAV